VSDKQKQKHEKKHKRTFKVLDHNISKVRKQIRVERLENKLRNCKGKGGVDLEAETKANQRQKEKELTIKVNDLVLGIVADKRRHIQLFVVVIRDPEE
jgi:hypothetical protein